MTDRGNESLSLAAEQATANNFVGSLAVNGAISSVARPEAVKIYSLEGLVRELTDKRGIFDVLTLVSHVVGDAEVPKDDIEVLEEEIRELSKSSGGITFIGEGLFEVHAADVPRPNQPSKKSKQDLEAMMRRELGPPRAHLPKSQRSRRAALKRLHNPRPISGISKLFTANHKQLRAPFM